MATDLSHLRSWERTRPIIPKNNIISSEWSAKKKRPRFLTSYENEADIQMAKLLSMEYARIWIIEREIWGQRQVIIDKRAARHQEWVKKWKEVQRGFRRADLQRIKRRKQKIN